MKIGVTSQNKLKIDAVEKAYSSLNISAEIVGYEADSGVGEQPVDEQTLEGARNRISDVNARIKGLDRIVSIENGIFKEDGQWLDRAVVVIYDLQTNQEYVSYSDAVVFPEEYVEKAREIGFDKVTVGQVMAEEGYVSNKKDPHLSISGKSRQVYLESAVKSLVERVEKNNP